MRAPGTLLLIGGTGGRRTGVGLTRRAELPARLPIGRVVGPDDVAALAVHLMTNTALTGATYDIDGGQQLLSN
jgi:NAD(P)-dependent dehydrogenase (short-subunit alcohol dehydrogenase family)